MRDLYIVAEIGCNHNGDFKIAKQMVLEAYNCGVNAVKFQTFNAKLLISKYAPKAEYQIKNTGAQESQLEMTRKLELSREHYISLKKYALELGLDVFSTGFDLESNLFLYHSGQTTWKIPSGEITNLPYLEQIAGFEQNDKIIILSTGMSSKEEIKNALEILKRGSYKKIILLHCNTEYPTEDADVNVQAILDLERTFPECEVGFSDHSRGGIAPILAIAYGVNFIEKHFTLDKNMDGPDHKASVNPVELRQLCSDAKRAKILLGDETKKVTLSEQKNKVVARKSIVAKKEIMTGDVFTEDNITTKRPGNGISPMYWYEVLGKVSEREFKEDELITYNCLNTQEERG